VRTGQQVKRHGLHWQLHPLRQSNLYRSLQAVLGLGVCGKLVLDLLLDLAAAGYTTADVGPPLPYQNPTPGRR
jgi:hypothetical protein